jgi:hypothetical protein
MADYPPLDKAFVSAYRYEDPAYPIVYIKKDPRITGYKVPALGSACPDSRQFPNHTFTGVTETPNDTAVIWVYEKLPGPILHGQEYDDEHGFKLKFTTQEFSSSTPLSTFPLSQVEPISSAKILVKTLDPDSLSTLSTYRRSVTSSPDIRLPDFMESATIHYTASGDGQKTSSNLVQALSGDPVTEMGSVSIAGGDDIRIKDGFRGPAPGSSTIDMFVPPDTVDVGAYVKTALSVSDWPRIPTNSEAIIIRYQSKSLRAVMRVINNQSVLIGNYDGSTMDQSIPRTVVVDIGNNVGVKVVNIPSCLHGSVIVGQTIAKEFSGDNVAIVSEATGNLKYSITAHPVIKLVNTFSSDSWTSSNPPPIPSGWTFIKSTAYTSTSTPVFASSPGTLTASTGLTTSTVLGYVPSTAVLASHTPSSFPSNMPSSWYGKCIWDMAPSAYKQRWTKVRVTVVDLANYHPSTW